MASTPRFRSSRDPRRCRLSSESLPPVLVLPSLALVVPWRATRCIDIRPAPLNTLHLLYQHLTTWVMPVAGVRKNGKNAQNGLPAQSAKAYFPRVRPSLTVKVTRLAQESRRSGRARRQALPRGASSLAIRASSARWLVGRLGQRTRTGLGPGHGLRRGDNPGRGAGPGLSASWCPRGGSGRQALEIRGQVVEERRRISR